MATFKLFSFPSRKIEPYQPITPPKPKDPKYQILIFDRTLFGVPDELSMFLTSLKLNILLASHITKFSDLRFNTQNFSILVYDFDGLKQLLQPTLMIPSNIREIIEALEQLKNQPALPETPSRLICWQEFETSFNSFFLRFLKEESAMVSFFTHNWSLDLDIGPELSGVRSLIQFKLDFGSSVNDDVVFGVPILKVHKDQLDFNAMDVLVTALEEHVDLAIKEHLFRGMISPLPKNVEISLPANIFSKNPVVVSCLAYPRILDTSVFANLDLIDAATEVHSASSGFMSDEGFKTRLDSVSRVKLDGICESHIFGCQSYILTDSGSSKYRDYQNRDLFRSLWMFLEEESSALIVKSTHRESGDILINGHFVIMTEPSENLVLKQIATCDTLVPLPLERKQMFDKIDTLDVESSFGKLKVLDEFDPFKFKTGMRSFLNDKLASPFAKPRMGATFSKPAVKKSRYQQVVFD